MVDLVGRSIFASKLSHLVDPLPSLPFFLFLWGPLKPFFVAHSVLIKLDSPQAAQINIHFFGKSVLLHLLKGPD